MEIMTVILLTVVLMAMAIIGMAITILIKKGGKFPNTHVSGNKHLKRNGVYCWQTQDKLAQKKAWEKEKFHKMKFVTNTEAGK